MTSMTDPKGRVTTYTYDGQGNRIPVETDPLLQTRSWTYDSHGNVLTETDKRGNTTTYHYDAAGNRDMMTAPPPLGYITTMTYDSVGNLRTRTDPNNHTTMFDYDEPQPLDQGNRSGRNITPDSITTARATGTQMIDRNNHSTIVSVRSAPAADQDNGCLSQMTTSTYDGNNNRTSMTDKNGHTTMYQYDVQNRLSTTTDAVGNVSTMTYDPVGNLTSSTDANLHTTTYTYDALNRRSTVTDAILPIPHVTMFEYDMGGSGCGTCGATPGSSLITKQTDGNGKVTYYKYDELDRLVKIVRKEGDTADVIDASDAVTSYTYDPNNNRLSMTEPNGNITAYEYDVLESPHQGDQRRRRCHSTHLRWGEQSHHHDRTQRQRDHEHTTTHSTGWTQVDDSIGRVANYTYDDVGNRLTQADGNGNTTHYSYDAIDRPTVVTDPLTRTTVTQYDPVGNVLTITDREGHITTNIYDNINRRTSSTDALGHTTQLPIRRSGQLLNDHRCQRPRHAISVRQHQSPNHGDLRRPASQYADLHLRRRQFDQPHRPKEPDDDLHL